MPGRVKVGFEATGGKEWDALVHPYCDSQLLPAQIKTFALSTRNQIVPHESYLVDRHAAEVRNCPNRTE